ncbi:hypothetical protein R1flu_028171 [Riccia fluitans]|uniref:Multicopper oxidase n=1 Tax=Riccia fluitans TaxID=41844 RepID=A0ABD1XPX9_9MARC
MGNRARRSPTVNASRVGGSDHGIGLALKIGFLAAVLGLQVSSGRAEHFQCLAEGLVYSPTLTPFIDALPILSTIEIMNGSQLVLGAYKITQVLHSNLSATTLYAYGTSEDTATYPGPTLEALRNTTSYVRFDNHITDNETFLTTDRSLAWANPPSGGVPIVTHLHGGQFQSDSDGHPNGWYTAAGDHGSTFTTMNHTYPNTQPASLLFYHDHTVGLTRITVLSGLTGLYIIRSPTEEPSNLPTENNEISLVIQDKTFWENGSIAFPDTGVSPENHPNWCPGYFGDTILVNGIVWPYLEVYPEKYRFRILNGANARFFTLTLSNETLQFIQIGTDGGFLPDPLYLTEITLAPAYRVDVIIDFGNMTTGTSVYMNNSAPAPFPDSISVLNPATVNSVMEFRIIARASRRSRSRNNYTIPSKMTAAPSITYNLTTDVYRNMTFEEKLDADGNRIHVLMNNARWTDPVTETPTLGTVEIWDLINFLPDAHPIHIHLINFLVVYKQSFNATAYTANECSILVEYPYSGSCFTEAPQEPNSTLVGWKDTVIAYPSMVTRLWIRWTNREGGPFPFNATEGPGYLWHCHLLDHEDNDMMRPLVVRE